MMRTKMRHKFEFFEDEYESLFFTHCCYCGERIVVDVPYYAKELRNYDIFSCNKCVPEKSCQRDGLNECCFPDVSDKLWSKRY